jgi:hypothetical protein
MPKPSEASLIEATDRVHGSGLLAKCAKSAISRSISEHQVDGLIVEGAESMPKSVFAKRYSQDATDNFERKLRTHGARVYEGYQTNSFNDPALVQSNVERMFDELVDLDPSNAGLLVRPDYRMLRVGTIVPGGTIRDKNGLKSAAADEVYMEHLEVVLLCFMEGVVKRFGTLENAAKSVIRASLPLDRGKSTGFRMATDGEFPDFTAGPDANFAMRDIIFPKMVEHPDGIFMYEHIVAENAVGYRAQNPTVKKLDDASYITKWRYSLAFGTDHKAHEATHWEPSDGYGGMRIRLINNISTVKQLPLVVVDKIFMGSLTTRMKTILKATPEEIASESIGGTCIDTDFGQFEFTQEDVVRTFIATMLFSDRVKALLEDIDDQDVIGAYVDDLENHTGETAKNIFWAINKRGNKDVRERFSVLLSGLGVTSLYGKALGLAEIGTIFGRSLGIDARTFWGYPGKDECPATLLVRNCGDDNRSLAHHVRRGDVSHNKGSYHKWFESHLDHINNDNRFIMSVEGIGLGGGSYIGIRNYNKNGIDPTDPDHEVEFSHVSHSRMISNIIQKENTIGSAHRPSELEFTSLHGALESAYRSMVLSGGREEEFWKKNVDVVLDLISCPLGYEEIEEEAANEAEMLVHQTVDQENLMKLLRKPYRELTRDEHHIIAMSRGVIVLMVMEHYQLKNADEIIWQVDRDDIRRDFGDVVFSALFLLIPDSLTKDVTRFINTATFERVRKDLHNATH